jgi:hypothetical protein
LRLASAEGKSVSRCAADIGYWVTDQTRHTFPIHEGEAFVDAVSRHFDEDPA